MYWRPTDRTRSHHPADRARTGRRDHHPDLTRLQGWKAMQAEADLPEAGAEADRRWALRMGLTGAESIEDRSIPTFARGELPHYAGINTFLKAPMPRMSPRWAITMPRFWASRSMAAPPIAPAQGSAPRRCAGSARFTPLTITKWGSICANR